MRCGRVAAVLVVSATVAAGAACGKAPSSRPVAPLSSVRVTHYPSTLGLRPGATPAGDGPIGSAIAAYTWCGSGSGCQLVLERVDGTQVTLASDIGDALASLSPDGAWLVYLRRNETVLRNLVTGAVQALPGYRRPLSWSPDARWLMFSGSYGGDFVVRDMASGAEVSHLHPSPAPTATAAPIEPLPSGPYFPAGITDQGRVVRYERPDYPAPAGAFGLDLVDPVTMAAQPIRVPLTSPQGVTPLPQLPVAPLTADTLYLQMSAGGALTLLPVSLPSGTVGTPVTVTEPGSARPVRSPATPADQGWTTVAALPGQGLLYRVRGTGGDDVVAVDPGTGRSQHLMHVREGWSLALAALPTR